MENNKVKKRILRLVTALYNACQKSSKEAKCNGCPFKVNFGCSLYEHPIEWGSKLKSAKE